MASVTRRIKEIKQPHGGYINPKSFSVIEIDDGVTLSSPENVEPYLVGTAVDYLTRALISKNPRQAFRISIRGALLAGQIAKAEEKLKMISGLSEESIVSACQLVVYDGVYRARKLSHNPDDILPNDSTIKNIATMVNRAISFFEEYGPVIKEGFVFSGGYTETVKTGDGDFITQDTLWDFKVSVSAPKSKDTLQLLMYYIMGLHSTDENLRRIKRLGIFNPRLNKVYLLNTSDISADVIKSVESDVIRY